MFLNSLTRRLPAGSNITITSILAYYNDGSTSSLGSVSENVGRRRQLEGATTDDEASRRELRVLYGVDVNYIVSTPR